MYHFKKNANQIISKCCQNDGVNDSHYIVCDSYANNRKEGFITNLQILITKLGLIICEATEEEDKVSYYKEAIKYLCVDVLNDKNLYNRFIQLKINELGNKGKHTIEELNKINMDACVDAFNTLIKALINKHSLTSLKTILISKNIVATNNKTQLVKPKAYLGNGPFCFVSYAHVDSDKVYPLIAELQKRNINVWFDEGILYGDQWLPTIINKISNCSFFIYMASNASFKSTNCKDEFVFAVDKKSKPWISIFLDKTKCPDWYDFSYSKFQGVNAYNFPSPEDVIDDLLLKCSQLKSLIQKNTTSNVTMNTQTNNNQNTSSNVKKIYKCPICGKDDFKTEEALKSHVNDKHINPQPNPQPSKDTKNKKEQAKKDKNKNNSIKAPRIKPFECPYCDRGFDTEEGLWSHIQAKHPDGPSFLWPILSGLVATTGVILLLLLVPFFKDLIHPFFSSLIGIGVGIVVFFLVYCLVTKSYIFKVFGFFIKGYFALIKMTYNWEIYDSKWILVPLKVLFIGIEFIFYIAVILFAIILCILLSTISFPFILYKYSIKRY